MCANPLDRHAHFSALVRFPASSIPSRVAFRTRHGDGRQVRVDRVSPRVRLADRHHGESGRRLEMESKMLGIGQAVSYSRIPSRLFFPSETCLCYFRPSPRISHTRAVGEVGRGWTGSAPGCDLPTVTMASPEGDSRWNRRCWVGNVSVLF
jgi:hypothetical protein